MGVLILYRVSQFLSLCPVQRDDQVSSVTPAGGFAPRDLIQVQADVFADPHVSYSAKGIFGLLVTYLGQGIPLSTITTWSHPGETASAVRGYLDELIERGYTVKSSVRRADGTCEVCYWAVTHGGEATA